jgi:cysteine sulfinate desulfinase/cysteine desulfurase-like protein|tara:strand:- start:1846 stop:2010 length:165 start_codon:yes stop_codon:yes gene_type:complete
MTLTRSSAPGLYANIQKKRARIKAGSDEKMRKPGTKGAPTSAAFKAAAKTRKKK